MYVTTTQTLSYTSKKPHPTEQKRVAVFTFATPRDFVTGVSVIIFFLLLKTILL